VEDRPQFFLNEVLVLKRTGKLRAKSLKSAKNGKKVCKS